MTVVIAPDLITVDDHTRAIHDVYDRRPADALAAVVRLDQLAELHTARSRLWSQLGDSAFDREGDEGPSADLVAAAWRCAAADLHAAREHRAAARRWERQAERARRRGRVGA